jgi:putative phosphoribosyl transferase
VISRQRTSLSLTGIDARAADLEAAVFLPQEMAVLTTTALPNAPLTRVVHIAAECGSLTAELTLPTDPVGVIVFARTNAAHRQTRYDHQLASALHRAQFGTLVFDLLTPGEEIIDDMTRGLRADVALLSRRLIEAIDWVSDQPGVTGCKLGVLGEGPGGAAAFVAACVRRTRVAAVVSYAERLDRAEPVLARVQAPWLIIVAGNDEDQVRSNDMAFRRLNCPKRLVRVGIDRFTTTGVTDKEISQLAFDWFTRILTPAYASANEGATITAQPRRLV